MRHIAFLTFILTLLHCPNGFANIISPVGFPTGIAEAIPAQASRTEGVAPLSVFFNAQLKPSSSTERSFHDYEYSWDFGDPNSGTWGTTGAPKNTDKGPVAAHVYETPGTYTATLTVKDSSDGSEITELTESFTISVTDPDTVFTGTLTTCISDTNNNDFTGCPAGSAQVSTDDISDLSTYAEAGERVLLHRGSSWIVSSNIAFSTGAGPVTIGAYGACENEDDQRLCSNAPHISLSTADAHIIKMAGKKDWRVIDLKATGPGSGNFITGSTGMQHNAFLRLHMSNFSTDIEIGAYRVSDSVEDKTMYNSIVDCNMEPGTTGHSIYAGGEYTTYQGNIAKGGAQHTIRLWQTYIGRISHNYISGASYNGISGTGYGGHAIKFHGPEESKIGDFATTGGTGLEHRTKFAVISDNVFGGSGPWPVGIGPQNDVKDERISDVIFEKNRIHPDYGFQTTLEVQVMVRIWSRYITLRNNIFDGTGGSEYFSAVGIGPRGIEPPPIQVRIYNNTVSRSDNGTTGQYAFKVGAAVTETIIKNNLVSFPGWTGTNVLISDTSPDLVQSHNIITDNPYFTSSVNTDPLIRDFSLLPDSTAINQGTTVPVFDDFMGTSRIGKAYDLGAYEYEQ